MTIIFTNYQIKLSLFTNLVQFVKDMVNKNYDTRFFNDTRFFEESLILSIEQIKSKLKAQIKDPQDFVPLAKDTEGSMRFIEKIIYIYWCFNNVSLSMNPSPQDIYRKNIEIDENTGKFIYEWYNIRLPKKFSLYLSISNSSSISFPEFSCCCFAL